MPRDRTGGSITNAKGRILLRSLGTLVHMVAFSQFAYGTYYDWFYVHVPGGNAMGSRFGGKFKFLTFWDIILQTLYFFVALLNDFMGSNDKAPMRMPLIRKVKDYMFSSLAFPVSMHVGITFWSLMAVDRELVFPKALDEFFPNWLNHLMHTNIMIFILMELFLSFRKYPSRKKGLVGFTIFQITYLIWVHVIYFYSGTWVYPVLDALNLPMRIVFFVAMVAFGYIMYLLGEFLNNTLWAKQISLMKKSGRQSVEGRVDSASPKDVTGQSLIEFEQY